MASNEIRKLNKNSMKVDQTEIKTGKYILPMRTKIKTNLDPFYNETKEKLKRCEKC